MNFPILSIITFVPILGLILVLLVPKDKERTIKWLATGVSLVPLALSIWLWLGYDGAAGGLQFVENVPWIPAAGISYHVGVDGISVPLIFLTALLTTVSLLYSVYTITTRVKEYFLLFLLLETGMLGVFVSLDFVLFYVFWEIGLVPMYLLIGVWGGKQRLYAAIKFFIYTLIGSVAMLLAILYIYFNVGSFSMVDAFANFQTARPFLENFAAVSLAFWAKIGV